MEALRRTDRTAHKRLPARGSYDRTLAHAILDEALVCHVGFAHAGSPVVIPTTFARVGDELFIHGAPASRMLKTLSGAVPVCVTVTLVDGLVMARSAMHHSMNYRAVVAFGAARVVTDLDEKRRALYALVEKVSPGRMAVVRPPSDGELKATSVLALPLDEASVKTRAGGPMDDPEDMDIPCPAGVIPLTLSRGELVPCGGVRSE